MEKNMKRPSLVVLAAGLGSRYGGLKQIDQFGPSGETLVDYALYDALKAGFQKVVFVIRKSMEAEFHQVFVANISKQAEFHYVFQELDTLPAGLTVPRGREKPWGTAHAAWTANEVVKEPFVIVNADDYYGRTSLKGIHDHLLGINDDELYACLVGYVLKNTLSDHGRVSRGICEVDDQGFLKSIVERTDIYKGGHTTAYYEENGVQIPLTGLETVSMNLMGFFPKVFDLMEQGFLQFFENNKHDLKAEYYIPTVLDYVRSSGIKVPVLKTDNVWFGVTYKDDKPGVVKRISDLVESGVYPHQLWN